VITPIATLPPSGTVILEDEFDAVLGTNWLVWGQPRPVIEQGFGDNYLSLKSPIAADAGVTSKAEFALEPDVEMNFRAQLQPGYSQYPLIFSWDPKQHVREPGNNEPGVLQVEISLDKVMISSALTSEQCVASIRGVDVHDYLLRIVGDNAVDLYVDGEAQPVCALTDIGMQAPIVGRITFRWMGLVSSVMVTSP
jgi:hypothetical protein